MSALPSPKGTAHRIAPEIIVMGVFDCGRIKEKISFG
jgi:hypothetical protein